MREIGLNDQQKKAVEFGEGPLLIIAGAGTGKTTVITERIKNLIKNKKIDPDKILALTFTEKAAQEMIERVDRIMPYGYTEMWISTFHSFCDNILKEDAYQIGLNPNYKLINEAEGVMLLRRHLFKLGLKYYKPLGNPNKFIEDLLQHFSRLKDEDVTPQQYKKFANEIKGETAADGQFLTHEQIEELSNAYNLYEELKIKEGLMDFSDLISNTLKLFRERPNVLKKYQSKFKFVLVDEFQDTNFAQNELAILIAGDKKNITVVADDDQAIYRFRGAAVSNVLQFKENFKGTEIISLTKNYRSTQEILNRSYQMIQNNNPNRLEVTENISKKLTSERKIKGKGIEIIFASKPEDEAENIAKKITELVSSDKYKYKDVAILVRANNHAHAIANFFSRRKIPYQFLGPGQLFLQDEIKDLIAYLKVLSNLYDSVSLFRVLSLPYLNISQRELNYFMNFARRKNRNLIELLDSIELTFLSDDTKKTFEKIKKIILNHIERIKKETAGQLLYDFLVETEIYEKLLSPQNQKEERIAQNIAKFFNKLKNFEYEEESAGVYEVIDWIELMLQMGDSPIAEQIDWSDRDAVSILTVHSSKGLEFPVVFIVNLVSDRFPSRQRREKIPLPVGIVKEKLIEEKNYHIQEERRLFYVAMTRARDLLFFTASSFYGEGKRQKKISPFVYEALPELKDKELLKSAPSPVQMSLVEIAEEFKFEEEKEEPLPNHKINSISYTQISAFDICPLHYRARYILGIPTEPSHALSFGITIHNVMNDFYLKIKKGEKVSRQDLISLLKQRWISEGYSSKEHEEESFERGKNILNNYYDKLFDPLHIPEELEMPFSFYLKNNVKVSGKIDRIDKLPDGSIEIIDYKTGEVKQAATDSYQFQLDLYALAAEKIHHPIFAHNKDVTLSLLYLDSGEKVTTKATREEVESVENRLIEKISEIEKSDFKCSKSILCRNCEYKMLCSASI